MQVQIKLQVEKRSEKETRQVRNVQT